jgi:hypothetical protein
VRWWGMSLGPGSIGDRGHVECGESNEEGERMWVAAGLEVVGCQVAQAHLQSPAACVLHNEGLPLDPPS